MTDVVVASLIRQLRAGDSDTERRAAKFLLEVFKNGDPLASYRAEVVEHGRVRADETISEAARLIEQNGFK